MNDLKITGNEKEDKKTLYTYIHENGLREEAKKILSHVANHLDAKQPKKVQKKKKIESKTPRKQNVSKTVKAPQTDGSISQEQMAIELRNIKGNLGLNQEAFAKKLNQLATEKEIQLGFKLTRAVLSCMINQSRPVKPVVYELAKQL